jgi:1-acyl-sn-glycerol-3-phosphate acyltransferase
LHRKALMCLRLICFGPIRVICCLLLLVTLRAVCALIQGMPSLRPWLLPATASLVSRGMLLSLGFLNIRHKRITKDPDTPDAPTAENRSRQSLPIVVSNHVSWVDILLAGYLYRCATYASNYAATCFACINRFASREHTSTC